MDKNVTTVKTLEILLDEFFSPAVTNERKQAIEQSLNEFVARTDCRTCLLIIEITNNNYVLMFVLSTLEKIIATKFVNMEKSEKVFLESSLYQMSLHLEVVPYVRNKIIKLVIDIAKTDFDSQYGVYENIVSLLERNTTHGRHLLGLKYLQIASDEIATPRKDFKRTGYVLGQFTLYLPNMLDKVTEILADNLSTQSYSGIKTPPPSPSDEHLTSDMNSLDMTGLENNSSNEICILSLKVLSHIFSYIDSFRTVSKKNKLFDLIFACAKYQDSMNEKQVEIAIHALAVINELFYRVDLSFLNDELLVHIFNNANELFHHTLLLDKMDECYTDKMTECLKLFVIHYLKWARSVPKCSIQILLEMLYHRTFHPESTINSYLKCLEIWIDLQEIAQLKELILVLNLHFRILDKISFRLDSRFLKELDTETLDENGETEWQHYLRCNIECLAKVAEMRPLPIFRALYQMWREGMQIFGELASAITSKPTVELNPVEATNCHNYLRDTASMTQALARLSSTSMYYENNPEQSAIEELITLTLDACDFVRNNHLYSANVQPVSIVHDIVEIHSQLLASLQAYCHWIWKRPDKQKEALCQRCINACIWAVSASHCDSASSKVIHSATHLFQSVIVILKPNLWGHPLYKDILCNRTYPFLYQGDTIQVLNKALINSITLPEGNNELRQQLLYTFISNFTQLLDTTDSQLFPNTQIRIPLESVVNAVMLPLKQILEDCSSSSTMIKKILLECLKPCIERAIQLLPHYMHMENTFNVLLSFLHMTFMVLQHQLGSEFMANTIKTLLQLFTSEHLFTGSALDQFLEILLCIVAAPNAFKSFIPSIISLCLVNVWPAISTDLAARQDTVLVMLRLFHSILIHRWKYFYATPILHNLCNNGSEVVEHKEELINILEIFGQALLQPDINIFRQSLECLEQVNTKWRLYSRELFKSHLLERYIFALMTVLVQKSQDLLTDEILITLYNMAMVDVDLFYNKYFVNFANSCAGRDYWTANKIRIYLTSTDQPTFTKEMLNMLEELRRVTKH